MQLVVNNPKPEVAIELTGIPHWKNEFLKHMLDESYFIASTKEKAIAQIKVMQRETDNNIVWCDDILDCVKEMERILNIGSVS